MRSRAGRSGPDTSRLRILRSRSPALWRGGGEVCKTIQNIRGAVNSILGLEFGFQNGKRLLCASSTTYEITMSRKHE